MSYGTNVLKADCIQKTFRDKLGFGTFTGFDDI